MRDFVSDEDQISGARVSSFGETCLLFGMVVANYELASTISVKLFC